jgi:hypothetical protein
MFGKVKNMMSSGEKAIWAAAYASEYRRWTLGPDSGIRKREPHEAAKFAIAPASDAVVAVRMAVSTPE